MAQQPVGDPAPSDGAIPRSSSAAWGGRPFGVYVHIPFCATRCGYCDFNTYTAPELAGGVGSDRDAFADLLVRELVLARAVLGTREVPVSTVFLGGGTPTMLAPRALGRILDAVRDQFGLDSDAEVTIEANPDSVDQASLAQLRDAGFTRLSLGMQSAAPHVLAVLDRTHTPGRAVAAARWAGEAGFERVSLDLIYGTPGEGLADWGRTIDTALGAGVGHVSAYALIVEPGTRLERQISRGLLAPPDDDLMADMYELADEAFEASGLTWYEISNWARPGHRSRHNLAYWEGGDWWGIGPGAHSHVGGTRWWNLKHPGRYAAALGAGRSPAAGREVLDQPTRAVERVLLELRLASGVDLDGLAEPARSQVPEIVAEGLGRLVGGSAAAGGAAGRHRLVLTRRGRLLADAVTRRLID